MNLSAPEMTPISRPNMRPASAAIPAVKAALLRAAVPLGCEEAATLIFVNPYCFRPFQRNVKYLVKLPNYLRPGQGRLHHRPAHGRIALGDGLCDGVQLHAGLR